MDKTQSKDLQTRSAQVTQIDSIKSNEPLENFSEIKELLKNVNLKEEVGNIIKNDNSRFCLPTCTECATSACLTCTLCTDSCTGGCPTGCPRACPSGCTFGGIAVKNNNNDNVESINDTVNWEKE
jgi:hypothetical protein